MYTDKHVQNGDACGAATLMIALYEFGLIPKAEVTQVTETSLYAKTQDNNFLKILGKLFSSPANIIKTAESKGLIATLYQKDDIAGLPSDIEKMKKAFVDILKPMQVDTTGMKNLMDSGSLQLLVYVDGDPTKMHWLLMRKDDGKYFIYDTAFGTNDEVNPEDILDFNANFTTGRQNNFFGVAILLTK